MSKGPNWSGEAEFQGYLNELNGITQPPPASKIKSIVSFAMKNSSEFKMIVYDIEKWMKKATVVDRISGIYIIDSLCRANRSQCKDKSKDVFSNRFVTRLNEIFMLLNGLSKQDLKSVQRVMDEWIKWDIFSSDKLTTAVTFVKSSQAKLVVNAIPVSAQIPTVSSSSGHEREREKDRSERDREKERERAREKAERKLERESKPRVEPIKIDEPAAEPVIEQPQSTVILYEMINKRKNFKYCPFRDGTCPFGDKCRYSHANDKIYFPSTSKKQKRTQIEVTSVFSSKQLIQHAMKDTALVLPEGISMDFDKIPRVTLPIDKIVIEFDGIGIDQLTTNEISITATDYTIFKKVL